MWLFCNLSQQKQVAEAVCRQFSEEELTQIAEEYVRRMRGVYDDLSEEALLSTAVSEVLADANGRMLRYENADATKFTETVRGIVGGFTEEQGQTQTGQRYSVVTLPDGKQFVRADRLVLFGNDSRAWSEQLEDYINGKIRRGEDVTLIGADGDELILTATSAGKLSSPYTSGGRTMSDESFERKGNAAAHIDELAETSTRKGGVKKDRDARHGAMAEGGWEYRTAYFEDFDGKYYEVTILAARSSDGTMIYNIGQMKEEAHPKVEGSSATNGNGPWGFASSKSSIRTNEQKSQEKNSAGQKYSPAEDTVTELDENENAPVFTTAEQSDWAFLNDGSRYYRLFGITPPGSRADIVRKSARAMDWAENGQKYTQELLNEVMTPDASEKTLTLPFAARQEVLKPALEMMMNEYLQTGRISQETMDKAFEDSCEKGVELDTEFYDQYKDVKKWMQMTAVTLSEGDRAEIVDFNAFRKEAFGQAE